MGKSSGSYLEDKNLSWKAKGMLAFLLNLPEDKRLRITIDWLTQQSKGGETIAKSCIKELANNSYMRRVHLVDGRGRFDGYITIFASTPEELKDRDWAEYLVKAGHVKEIACIKRIT